MTRASYNFEGFRQRALRLEGAKTLLDQKLTQLGNEIAQMEYQTNDGASDKSREVFTQFQSRARPMIENLNRASQYLQGVVSSQQQLGQRHVGIWGRLGG